MAQEVTLDRSHADLRVDPQTKPLPAWLERIDRFQQQHAFLAIPVAVYRKFSDDDGAKLASLVSYYAFLSVFPLLIVFATIVSKVLVNYPELADEIVTTAAGSFLSVGAEGTTIKPLDVSGVALVLGIVVGVWSGLAVTNGIQDAMDTVYEVPKTRRLGFVPKLLHSIALLVLIGVGLPLMTVLHGVAVRAVPGVVASALIVLVVLTVNTGIFATSFRTATVGDVSWREVLPGAVLAAIAWSVMQALATGLLTRKVAGAESDYGTFAIVVAILFWFFLLSQVTLYCAELNVVLAYRLWPRGLKSVLRAEADTEADVRAYSHYPEREQQAKNMDVQVEVVEDADGASR